MRKTAVIIVHWESPDDVATCIRSLDSDRIIVVDNASSQGAYDRLPKAENVTIIRASANSGYGAGCNLGARHAHDAEFLFFLNPDTIVKPGCVEVLEEILTADPGCVAVSPTIERMSDGAVDFDGGSLSWWKGATRHRSSSRPDWLTGAAMMVRTRVFEKIDGFDESFFMYWEDVDLSLRLWRHGRLTVGDRARIAHAVSPHLSGTSDALYYSTRNALKVVRRYRPWYLPLVRLRYRRIARSFRGKGEAENADAVDAGLSDFQAGIYGPRPRR